MDIDNIDIQIEWYEFQLVNSDTCDDTGQICYELATLRFNKQLIIVKERIERMNCQPSTTDLFHKIFPFMF